MQNKVKRDSYPWK